jgi:DNA-binding helix-hairpin-helix protein with protein kinase domain
MTAYILQFSGEAITLGPVFATGGEARVHVVSGHPELLAKLYTKKSPDIEDKLAAMITAPPPCLSLGGGYAEAVWPLDIVRDADAGNACVGYVMRYVRNRLRLEEIANPAICPPQIDFSCRLRMATNLAWMTAELQAAGYVVGDLHLGNMLADQAGCVSFIDTDSFQFVYQGRLFRCEVGKREFIAPELHNKNLKNTDRTIEQDAFSLAIGIFQLLMDGNHPYQGKWIGNGQKPPLNKRIVKGIWPYSQPAPKNWRPRSVAPPLDILHPRVRKAMIRCFKRGHGDPGQRPSANRWHQLLLDVENDQTYLKKVSPLYQKAAWRTQSPGAISNFRQAFTGKWFSRWASRLAKWTHLHRLGKKWGIRLAATFAVLLLCTFLAIKYRSAVAKALNLDAPHRYSTENYGHGKPTPKLWQVLRDSSKESN